MNATIVGFSPAERETYTAQGWLVRKNLMAAEQLDALTRAITAQLDTECKKLIEKRLLTSEECCFDAPFDERFGRVIHQLPDDKDKARRILLAAMQDLYLTGRYRHEANESGVPPVADTLLECIRHDPLLDCIESLVGPDIIGSSTFRIRAKIPHWTPGDKLPYFPAAVPWHQDAGYMLPHCDSQMIVTCWIPLVDATIDNGCLVVYPWQHQKGVLPHEPGGESKYIEIPSKFLQEKKHLPIEMQRGDVLFLNNMTPHASFDNTSQQTRWSMDIRYASAAIPNNIDEDPNTYGPERDPSTMACAPTEADFVIRDSKRPEREVRSGEDFFNVRMRYAAQYYHPGLRFGNR